MEGKLHIEATWDGAVVTAAGVHSSRMLQASCLLQGKPVQEAINLVPLLFSICGHAQGIAAVMAAEAALGAEASGQVQTTRMRLALVEAMQEHLWRILLDWPQLAGLPPRMQAMTEMRARMRDVSRPLLAAGGWKTAGGKSAANSDGAWLTFSRALKAFLRREVFGCAPAQWLELQTPTELEAWCGSTDKLAAQVLRGLAQNARFGASRVAAIPAPHGELLRRLAQAMQSEAEFSQQPSWCGCPMETGALSRQLQHPLMQALTAAEGNTVFVRVVARLLELARLAATHDQGAAWMGALPLNEYAGIAWAETARGLLMHRTVTDGERVLRYQIVAPTEWNFHANGALVQGLRGMAAPSAEAARSKTEWLVQSLDPCVAYEITVRHADMK